MSMYINTNILSLNAQRNLNTSQASLSTALERLSSGLRINSAKDDAAGMSIAARMTSQITGLDQGARNANDAVSLTQTAEGALSNVVNNLQRMRELSVQSANATNSASDRAALQNEFAQLSAENDRVATSTKFNGVSLIDGSFKSQNFQIGANAGDTINIASIASAQSSAIGQTYAGTGSAVTAAIAAGDLTINGAAINASTATSVPGQAADSAFAIAAAINLSSGTGVTASANSVSVTGVAATTFTAVAAGDIVINGVSVGAAAAGGAAPAQGTNVATAINLVSSQTGVTAVADAAGKVTLTAADGRNISLSGTGTTANTGLTLGATTRGTISLNTGGAQSSIAIGGATSTAAGFTAPSLSSSTLVTKSVSALDISSATGAVAAMQSLDAALASVNSSKSSLGAYQNRFLSAITNLQNSSQNLTEARSRIQDTDFAAETANLTRGQILQQAGTAMLAQANQLPNGVMALLR
ncbi:MAG: flagellin [Paralcaligenes sp.]